MHYKNVYGTFSHLTKPITLPKMALQTMSVVCHTIVIYTLVDQERGLKPSEASRPASKPKVLHLMFLMRWKLNPYFLSLTVILCGLAGRPRGFWRCQAPFLIKVADATFLAFICQLCQILMGSRNPLLKIDGFLLKTDPGWQYTVLNTYGFQPASNTGKNLSKK